MATVARIPRSSLPPIVPVLALGAFLMCTTEFMIAGLLPQMAADFGVRPSRIGLLITAFAIGMIVGAPAMAIATLHLPKRATLVLALAIFAAGHAVAALTVSAFNGGIAVGTSVGGHTLDSSLGEIGPAAVGAVMVALGLIPLAALAVRRTRPANHRIHPCAAHPARA
jgi:predicted MFS family arabinose efflux permease